VVAQGSTKGIGGQWWWRSAGGGCCGPCVNHACEWQKLEQGMCGGGDLVEERHPNTRAWLEREMADEWCHSGLRVVGE
jgi:hypothetical protein